MCPGCGRAVRMVVCPVPITIPAFLDVKFSRDELDEVRGPAPCFACVNCHRVQGFSRFSKGSWEQLIAHVSGGMLYGREVRRPAWMSAEREGHPRRRKTYRSSPMRKRVMECLLADKTLKETMEAVGLSMPGVGHHIRAIFKAYGVHSRGELIAVVRERGLKEEPEVRYEPPKRRMPPVPPDYVWYKWKDGVYVGDEMLKKGPGRGKRSVKG